jgi:hypothetical protein
VDPVQRRGKTRLVAFGAVCAAVALSPQACSSRDPLAPKGAACFLAGDCEPGLVCVPQDNGNRICSDDLSQVAGKGPPDAAADVRAGEAGEGGDAPADGPPTDGPPPDTGQDTGPADTGSG